MPQTEPPLLLTIQRAAQELSMSRSKVYTLIRDGKLKAFRFDGNIRVRHSDLVAFVNSQGEPVQPKSV